MLHAVEGNPEALSLSLNHKSALSQLELQNAKGHTALALAVKAGQFECAELLVKKGANVNAINKAKQSVLFLASYEGHLDICEMLFETGKVKVDTQDIRGWTALMMASQQGFQDIVELLIKHDADVSLGDKFGKKAHDRAKNQKIFYVLSSA
jgi:ankyrin repeat protein